MIRAKFLVHSVTKHSDGAESIEAHATSGRTGTANAQWAKMTPSGKLTMHINNPDAHGKIKPGKHYFLDISEAEDDA